MGRFIAFRVKFDCLKKNRYFSTTDDCLIDIFKNPNFRIFFFFNMSNSTFFKPYIFETIRRMEQFLATEF